MLVMVALRIGLKLLYNEGRLCIIQDGHGIGRVAYFVQSLRKTGIFDMIPFAIQISNQRREIS